MGHFADQRIALKGHLSELRDRLRKLDVHVQNHLVVLNMKANGITETEDLDIDAIQSAASLLHEAVLEFRDVRARIAKIEADLG